MAAARLFRFIIVFIIFFITVVVIIILFIWLAAYKITWPDDPDAIDFEEVAGNQMLP